MRDDGSASATVLLSVSESLPDLSAVGPELISAVAAMSAEERRAYLDAAFDRKRAAEGEIVAALGEVDRSQDYREEGATSTESWVVERYGISQATARGLMRVSKVAWDLPHLVGSLSASEISLDKVRAVSDVATPETDRELRDQARQCGVRELTEIARTMAARAAADMSSDSACDAAAAADSVYERRYLRFNDECRTMTAQLPPESYAELKARLEAVARDVPSDGGTPWDQRCCDALMEVTRTSSGTDAGNGTGTATGSVSASPFLVVAHVPLTTLVDKSGRNTVLAGELDHLGLIDSETVRRIACDATITVAVDDDVGHTMYEGRARRFPTRAQRREVMRRDRHCRFPDCTNVTFINVHHVVPWEPGGLTDLDNLALQCLYHHHLVHSDGWSMSGNANEELTIIGPTGRVMTSRPSTQWTRVTGAPPG
jgi:hypothetical protein